MNPETFDEEYEALKESLLQQYNALSANDFVELVVARLMLNRIAVANLQKELSSCKSSIDIYQRGGYPSEG